MYCFTNQTAFKKFTFNEKFEYENLENELSELEKEKKELELLIQSPDILIDKITSISERLAEIVNLIEKKEFRWMELDEKNIKSKK